MVSPDCNCFFVVPGKPFSRNGPAHPLIAIGVVTVGRAASGQGCPDTTEGFPETTKKIILALDNYSVHKTKTVHDFLKEHAARLRLVFLPTYSPWLNPIELFWRHLKKQVLPNRFFESIAAELRELWRCLKDIAADCQRIRYLIGANAS